MASPSTVQEKFTKPYTADEINLLIRLRSQTPPMGWTEIHRVHFPTRSPAALKAKMDVIQRGAMQMPDADDGTDPWAIRAAQGSAKLGAAIEAMKARHGGGVAA